MFMLNESEDLGEILQETHGRVPYNSFGKILLSAGLSYPSSIGGNCVYQCRELVRAMIGKGHRQESVSFTTALERPHWVVLYQGEARYLLDPFIFQKELLNVDRLFDEGSAKVPLYPVVRGQWSTLECKVDGPSTFEAHLKVPRLSGEPRRVLTYHYDVNALRGELPPNDYQLLAAQVQKELVLTYRSGEVLNRMYMDPATGEMRIFISGEGRIPERHDPKRFKERFTEMALRCELPPDELRQLFRDAREIYNRLKKVGPTVE